MSTKRCVVCGDPKRPGHPRWCEECWLFRQPAEVQVAAARARRALIPEQLHVARVPKEHWPPNRRWCAGCQTFVHVNYTSGSRCQGCASAAKHASTIKSKYTLGGAPFTQAHYDRLYAMQGGRCYLCRRRSPSRRFAIDHDHRTGEVRGLLCPDPEWGCNLKVIARFDADDDPLAMAQRLVDYLRDPPAKRLLTTS